MVWYWHAILISVVVCLFVQGDPVYKNVFVLFFQGDQLRMRVKKICEGYAIYVCSE